MNNYCTNCGKKLENKAIKCDECNTYVIDLKVINKRKILNTIGVIIIVLILGIITTIIGYNLYYKNLNKSIYDKYLKDNFKNLQYVKYEACHLCIQSCSDSCLKSSKVVGCFKYYYKSNYGINDPDIIVFYNKGNVSIDAYSSIINKYGFIDGDYEDKYEEYYVEYDKYRTEKRSSLYIKVNLINSDSIVKIYEMVNEIIDIYKLDNKEALNITIYDDSEDNRIKISNEYMNNGSTFMWKFNNNTQLLNPNLNDLKNIYSVDDTYNSLSQEYSYND